MASVCDLLGRGEVVIVDIPPIEGRPEHDRITYLTGSSTAGEVVAEVERHVAMHERVLVILDSDHSRDHVLDELRTRVTSANHRGKLARHHVTMMAIRG
jgi:cephalosporin hydroxylase